MIMSYPLPLSWSGQDTSKSTKVAEKTTGATFLAHRVDVDEDVPPEKKQEPPALARSVSGR